MSDELGENSSQSVWQAEAAHSDICAIIREALAEVTDPELGMSVIQLGLIRDVSLEENHIIIKMILTTPYCPYGPAMLEKTREKAAEATGLDVSMDFSVEPWDFSMMEENARSDWSGFGIF